MVKSAGKMAADVNKNGKCYIQANAFQLRMNLILMVNFTMNKCNNMCIISINPLAEDKAFRRPGRNNCD